MLKHKFIVFVFILLLVCFYIIQIDILYVVLLFFAFIGQTAWGVFDIRLNYFSKNICQIKKANKNEIALTFDDGPHEKTLEILEILKQYNTKATFFCIGKQIEKHPEIFKKIIAEGHSVGNHSYSHQNSHGFLSTQNVVKEIEKTNTIIQQYTQKENVLYRPPFGITNPNIARAIKQTQQTVIGWNIRSLDTIIEDDKVILQRVTKNITSGSIVLLHDTSSKTIAVLEQLLLFLQTENYQSKTIEHFLYPKTNEN